MSEGLQLRKSAGKTLWCGAQRIRATRMPCQAALLQKCTQCPFFSGVREPVEKPLSTEVSLLQWDLGMSETGWKTALPACTGCPQHKHPTPLRETRRAWGPTGVEAARDRQDGAKCAAREVGIKMQICLRCSPSPPGAEESFSAQGTVLLCRHKPATVNRFRRHRANHLGHTQHDVHQVPLERTWVRQTAGI